MVKLIIQSRLQNVIDRAYKVACFSLLQFAIASLCILAFDVRVNQDQIHVALVFIAFIVTVPPIWLAIFNTGKSRMVEHGVKLSEDSFELIRLGESSLLSRSEIIEFKVAYGLLGKQLSITDKSQNTIRFGYYVFNARQKRQIIAYLQAAL
ncbi:hypothetical protein [Pseudoalteromonas umbrosa]|uniref:hypothetical protein n=1 Tax=Pseudoalteromonas umbrosa TaxID=3048489 RepID=UPI0024C4697D|nr:hypothetical protein [Pseudoalteromonas sp. B95]MDK1288448.1 hypothetical protein [Pseudoalteromonas sp. B95]